jgi:uncharacterized protein YpmB
MLTQKKVVFGAIAVFSLLLFGLSQFFQTIQAGAWSEERQAVETAYQKTIMAKATKVDTFVGTQAFKIVYGEDAIGQQVIVWLGETEIHTEYAADGLKDKELRMKFAAKEPAAKLLRILPGKVSESYVWELFYEKPGETGKPNYYYDYVTFNEGMLIDTYHLGEK